MSGSQKTVLGGVKVIFSIILSLIFYGLIIFAVSRLCIYVYDFGYQIFGNVAAAEAPGTDVDFTINEGDSTMSIASRLEYNKLIVNKYSFYIRAKLDAQGSDGSRVMPGTYELNTSMNYEEILSIITSYDASGQEEGTQ